MRRAGVHVVWGLLLVAGGLLLLLQNFGVVGRVLALSWPLLFGAAGAVFLYVFLTHRAQWWAIIPGFALLGVAALMAVNALFPRVGDTWGGLFVLGAIGLSFVILYLTGRDRWWALIPAGVMLTLALLTVLSSIFPALETEGVLFLGLALTFGALSLLSTPQGQMRWALVPAAVFLIIGLLVTPAFSHLWPAALVLLGLYLVLRALLSRRRP